MSRILGQHFLKNKSALRKITAALEITHRNIIIEIGPGHGELTRYLLETKSKKIIAVEKDKRLTGVLRKKLQIANNKYQTISRSQIPNVKIVEGDILKILPDLTWKLETGNWKLVGNIPYYLTGHLLRKISELERKPRLIVFTVQKEVAERIVAEPPRMNLLAASVQFWGKPKIIGYIPKKLFQPQPKVDSAIIKITPSPQIRHGGVEGKLVSTSDAERYYRFIRVLFKQPRKTVLNNLREGLNLSQKEAIKQLEKLNISPELRPADLPISDINKLAKKFLNKKV